MLSLIANLNSSLKRCVVKTSITAAHFTSKAWRKTSCYIFVLFITTHRSQRSPDTELIHPTTLPRVPQEIVDNHKYL